MICGLDLLAASYSAAVYRAQSCDSELLDLKDWLTMWLIEGDKGAEEFLREIAAEHVTDLAKRRAAGRAV